MAEICSDTSKWNDLMEVTLLGTGSPAPSKSRASSGYLIQAGDDKILIDCGPNSFDRLLETGSHIQEVTHFVLSHLHFDHYFDFIRLFHNRWDRGRDFIAPLTMYGPPGFQQLMEQLFGMQGAFAPDIRSRIYEPIQQRIYEKRGGNGVSPWPETKVTELQPGDVVTGTSWSIRVESVPHYQDFLVNLGVRLEADAAVFAYSSDVHTLPGMQASDPQLRGLLSLAAEADLLVHYYNGGHEVSMRPPVPQMGVSARMMGEIASLANVRRLVTTHHGPSVDTDQEKEKAIADIRQGFHGELTWGEDLMSFQIGE